MTTAACRGFVYATAVMGVTGARTTTSDLAGPLVARTQRGHRPPGRRRARRQQRRPGRRGRVVRRRRDRRLGVRPGPARPPRRPGGRAARAGRADRGPRRRGPACVDRWSCRRASLAVLPARRGVRRATRRPTSGYHGAVLDQPYVVAGTALTDTDGAAVLAGRRHRQAADPGLLRLHALPGHLPGRDGQPRLGDDPARRAGPRAGRRGLRDHRPGPRQRAGAAALPRPLRPGLHRPHRRPRDDHRASASRWPSPSSRARSCRAAATTSCHGTQVTAIDADDQVPSAGPRTPPPADFAADIHSSCWTRTDSDDHHADPSVHSRARPRASGTSARSRSAATRCASSLGIVAAIWIGERRWVARGGRSGEVQRPRVWAVPFGLVGGRLYHVITDYRPLLRRGRQRRGRRSTSGGAASASGARSRSAPSASSSAPGARGSGCCRCSTRWRRACWSRRRSAAGATGSTRSCSASRPTCRGAWRSTPRTGRRATSTGRDLPPDVPLRVALVPRGASPC